MQQAPKQASVWHLVLLGPPLKTPMQFLGGSEEKLDGIEHGNR